MSKWNLRKRQRNISYYEPEEPPFDDYVYCDGCADMVYEYCAIHGPLLVVPDDKVPVKTDLPSFVPRAALTIPHVFLHLAPSIIPGAGLGVFSSLTLPHGVRFGPYRGKKVDVAHSDYCWQIYDKNNKPSHLVEADDAQRSNWMRYVNCARHWCEQNMIAYQYQGQIYYRTIKIIPRFTELLVFYGSEFANSLQINLRLFNSPLGKENLYNIVKKSASSSLSVCNTASSKVTDNVNMQKNKDKDILLKNTTVIQNKSTLETKEVETLSNSVETNNINDTNNIQSISNKVPMSITYTLENRAQNKKGNNNNVKMFRKRKKEKKHECNVCSKKFSQISHLKIHLRTHTGEKPYECNDCSEKFSQIGNLKKHLRTHTGEKPYECNFCSKKFSQIFHLKRHLRTHTGEKPYECNVCSKKFSDLGNLKNHLRTHTGEKPYECNVCLKKFSEIGNLKKHLRTHTGEKPYECNVCHSKFTYRSYLSKHILIHNS